MTTKHAPRKRFGQHFLIDPAVLTAIVAAVRPRPAERLIEIGPGLGALTTYLLPHVARLTAVEIDRDLVARLQQRWPAERLELIQADALTVDWAALGPARLVGNLPYNISTPLLLQVLAAGARVIDAHFMLQKEVVDRMVAQPGCAEYGRLSVMVQAHGAAVSLFNVPPEAFDPPPRVESAVVRLQPHAQPWVQDRRMLERLLAVAFNQRRKMLRGTLWPWLRQQGLEPDDLPMTIAPTARPEEIAVPQWVALADWLTQRLPT